MTPAFPWPGGKRRMARRIIEKLPEHDCYVEVFGGGLAVLLAKERSKMEVANDIDSDLIRFYRCVRFHRDELLREIAWVLNSREEFYDFRQQPGLTDIQRAARWLKVQTLSWGGKGESFGTAKKKGGGASYSSRARQLAVITQLSDRLDRVAIEHLHWAELVDRYDATTTCFFFDPPYVEGYQYGVGGWSEGDHEVLADRIRAIEGGWVLTYDDTDLVRELYAGCQFDRHERKAAMGNNHGKPTRTLAEVIITPA